MPFELFINGGTFDVHSLDELRLQLGKVNQTQFSELELCTPDGWPVLHVLVNGEAAWLMFLRHEGDAGFSTRNPDCAGSEKDVIEFYLSNGQRDEYPASWNITTIEALRALEYFFTDSKRAPWLAWHED
jgi:hypothetical protein